MFRQWKNFSTQMPWSQSPWKIPGKSLGFNHTAPIHPADHEHCTLLTNYYPGQKKKNHPRDSRREERCSTCDIMLDQRRAKVADSRGSDLPCADRAWSSMITHVEQRSSRRESRWWFFFFVQGSRKLLNYFAVPRPTSFFHDVLNWYTAWDS